MNGKMVCDDVGTCEHVLLALYSSAGLVDCDQSGMYVLAWKPAEEGCIRRDDERHDLDNDHRRVWVGLGGNPARGLH